MRKIRALGRLVKETEWLNQPEYIELKQGIHLLKEAHQLQLERAWTRSAVATQQAHQRASQARAHWHPYNPYRPIPQNTLVRFRQTDPHAKNTWREMKRVEQRAKRQIQWERVRRTRARIAIQCLREATR